MFHGSYIKLGDFSDALPIFKMPIRDKINLGQPDRVAPSSIVDTLVFKLIDQGNFFLIYKFDGIQ